MSGGWKLAYRSAKCGVKKKPGDAEDNNTLVRNTYAWNAIYL